MAKDIKLNRKQKKIIELMRSGEQFNIGGCAGVVIPYSKQCEMVNAGIVITINPFVYELTELGKTIKLD